MTTVELAPARPLDQVPRQLVLDRPSLLGIADACRVQLDWLPGSGGAISCAAEPAPEVCAALTRFASAADGVDLDVVVRGRDGTRRARSWQRRRGGWVTSLATVDGGDFELTWCADSGWPAVLARAARVRTSGRPRLPAVVDLPLELLVGVGEARASGRTHVIDELVRRYAGRLGPGADPRRLVADLHTGVQGRLRAVVVSYAPRPAAGVIEWLLFPDGWRSLATYPGDDLTMVRLAARTADHLAVDVAATLTSVAARARSA
ncbi:hypothetical protein [Nocardioides speluncae]|uniref:hypothetical protein n=1 Tax=Nocardioides speluncae TaxID=2670337 RepID=UPI000D69A4DA|nr:hypothetical protein [Nocardioides speluncae]